MTRVMGLGLGRFMPEQTLIDDSDGYHISRSRKSNYKYRVISAKKIDEHTRLSIEAEIEIIFGNDTVVNGSQDFSVLLDNFGGVEKITKPLQETDEISEMTEMLESSIPISCCL